MQRAYSLVLSLLLVFASCTFETACTSSQFNKTVGTIQMQLPAAIALGQDIAVLVGKPGMDPAFAKVGLALSADLDAVSSAVNAYFGNENSGTKNAIFV